MSDLILTPADSTTPELRLPSAAFRRGQRHRSQEVQKEGVIAGSGSFSAAESLMPGEYIVSGLFRGAKAPDAAKRLRRDFIDADVEEVDVAVPDESDPLESGTYVLEKGDVRRVHRRISSLYQWQLKLVTTS